ncbi:AMP-binding protein [Streptomyces sp. TG1A-8]|uniref:AMP-binding protein n=1 Tax=Streptomyces sp. TG1A-8 TaxID=3051385 RepID=UPI00265B88BB|nr:AMP-binding protein [Streptomyces sp. TG1A-8]MDO0924392.1 AMP-binding protein [Streptomyces sp. TG1A-8]
MSADTAFRADLIRPLHELLAGHAARQPDRVAFKDARRAVTYAELDRRTARVAGHLVGLGLDRGACAVIHLENRVEMVEAYLAITRASAVGVPVNPRSTDVELGFLLDDCAARLVVTSAAQLPQVRRVLADRPGVAVVLVGDGPDTGPGDGRDAGEELPRWEVLASTWSLRDPPRDDLRLDEPAWMLYTSGTTGRPKGVVSTQRGSLWATAACNAPLLGLSARDTVVWPMPLFHAVAHNIGVLGVLAVGATARITDGLAAEEILRLAHEEAATFLVGVPTLYHQMVDLARSGAVQAPPLRVCMVAGSSCPQSLHEAFRAAFGIPLLDSYGSTETGGAITTNLPEGPYVPGSCGVPLPGLTLRLVDPRTRAEAEPGGEGEVWVSSPALMLGYHQRPRETAEVLSDGWYRTGDLARQDADGYVTITGRLKELIIRGGENIHPGEVERALAAAPGVADAAVAGKPHPSLGEVPVAYLVPGPDGVDVEAVLAVCRQRLSAFKLPEEIHEIAEVPRNPAGKVARKRLAGLPARLLWRRSREVAAAAAGSGAGAAGLGLTDGGHPLLTAAVELPERDETVWTGRVTAREGDPSLLHRDGGGVLTGSALLEMVLHAADRAGCARVAELTVTRPLVLPEDGGVQLRVSVGAADADGTRPVAVHGRRDARGAAGRPWTRHAHGRLAPEPVPDGGWRPQVWPPRDAEQVPAPAAGGAHRTPQGLWRRGAEVFAEVVLPGRTVTEDAFGLHPALLEGALSPQVRGAAGDPEGTGPDAAGSDAVPVRWQDVSLYAVGARVLRVRLCPAGDGAWSLDAVDGAGDPVLTARAAGCAPLLERTALAAASAAQQDGLFEQVWETAELPGLPARPDRWAVVGPDGVRARAGLMSAGRYSETHPDLPSLLGAVEQGAPVPDVVVVSCAGAGQDADEAAAVRSWIGRALGWVRLWADPRFADSRLVVVTRDAVAAGDDGVPEPCAAAVWALIGAAQDRAPGRFALLDTDGSKRSWRRAQDAVASGEPRLALRGGRTLRPGAARPAAVTVAPPAPGRCALFAGREEPTAAERFVTAAGPAGPLLAGPFAKNAADRMPEGAFADPLPWDPMDPVACVRPLLDGGTDTIVFAASVRSEATAAGAQADVDAALRPVVDPALELGRLAAGRGVPRVVFAAPSPREAGLADAAVGAVLDVCARRLRAAGVSAVTVHGPAAATGEAVDLFAAAVSGGAVSVTAERPDLAVAPHGALSATAALLRGLLPGVARRPARDALADPSGLRHRLAELSGAEQDETLLRLVRGHLATALGRPGAARVPADGEIRDLGFDSLTALTARNALQAATGLDLPASVVFDHATPAGLARRLKKELLAG